MTDKQSGKGRPSKLTPDRQAKICDALKAGSTRKNAAEYAGVGKSTMRQWELDFPEFLEALELAEAECEARNVAVIQKAGSGFKSHKTVTKTYENRDKAGNVIGITSETTTTVETEFDWRASAWWLERRRSDDYKLKQATDITSNGEQLPVIGMVIHPPQGAQTA